MDYILEPLEALQEKNQVNKVFFLFFLRLDRFMPLTIILKEKVFTCSYCYELLIAKSTMFMSFRKIIMVWLIESYNLENTLGEISSWWSLMSSTPTRSIVDENSYWYPCYDKISDEMYMNLILVNFNQYVISGGRG